MELYDQVICGDCLEVIRGWPDGCIDTIITDFPFDMVPSRDLISEFYRVLKRDAWFVFWFPFKALREYVNVVSERFEFVWMICHVKYNSGKFCPVGYSKMEAIMVFRKGHPKLNYKMDDVIIHPVFCTNEAHPYKKDECVTEHLVRAFSKPGDTVLDPMCGSGTTLVVAKKLGRRYVGIDIDPYCCELARGLLGLVSKLPDSVRDLGLPVQIRDGRRFVPMKSNVHTLDEYLHYP